MVQFLPYLLHQRSRVAAIRKIREPRSLPCLFGCKRGWPPAARFVVGGRRLEDRRAAAGDRADSAASAHWRSSRWPLIRQEIVVQESLPHRRAYRAIRDDRGGGAKT